MSGRPVKTIGEMCFGEIKTLRDFLPNICQWGKTIMLHIQGDDETTTTITVDRDNTEQMETIEELYGGYVLDFVAQTLDGVSVKICESFQPSLID